jgi:hypothetical protein
VNLVCCIRDRSEIEGELEEDTEEGIWTKMEVVIDHWRKLHNEELHNLYSSYTVR